MDLDDRQLLDRIARGGEDARASFAALYARHAADVQRFLRRTIPPGGATSDADDLLHDVFVVAARSAAGFRRGSALPWLLEIAARRVATRRRGEHRRRAREERAASPEVADEPAAGGRTEELVHALAALPAHLRATVELRFVDELAHSDVARVLGVSERTAKSWARQALDALHDRLKDDRP
jgi:RNA polymerase sigma factor (sigma-70 family)